MADPLSIGASLLAVVTAAIQSSKSLCATVQRYKERDKTLNRLHGELEDLVNILDALQAAVKTEATILKLLEGPINRCSHVCRDFEVAMQKFHGKSKLGLIDWARMEFMSSDINGFMDALSGYKATITVGLGTITMQNSKINNEVLEEYNEMIKDTAYNLTIHLQRIDARLEQLTASGNDSLNTSINLQDEKDVTHQCLRICESAKTYLESLQNEQQSMLRQETSLPENVGRSQFEAQVLTQKVFAENRGKLIETIGCLQERLLAIISSTGPERNRERLQLQEDLDVSRQCLEVCDQASRQVSNQKIHTIGEVVADDDTDQVVVTTLADLFDVRKVLAKNRSAQLVGSMTDDALIKLSGDRYGSRFGALNGNLGRAHIDVATYESNAGHPGRMKKERALVDAGQRTESPVPNEMRKRSSGFENRR